MVKKFKELSNVNKTIENEKEKIVTEDKKTSLLPQSKKIKKMPVLDTTERRRTRSMKNKDDDNKSIERIIENNLNDQIESNSTENSISHSSL